MLQKLALLLCLVSLSGCATRGYLPLPYPLAKPRGTYYKIKEGDTIWRIAMIQGIGMHELVKINKLPNAARIMPGQLIFIPEKEKVKTPYPQTEVITFKDRNFVWPIRGKIVAFYGEKRGEVTNKGIDIIGKKRINNVVAARSGKVVFREENLKGYGKAVILDHGDEFLTVYANLAELLVSNGELVKQKTTIAKTSRLHFEIRKKHKPENPCFYLP